MSGIDIVVVQRKLGMVAARLSDRTSQRLALEQIKIERDRKHENFPCTTRLNRQRIDGRQRQLRTEAQNLFRGLRYGTGLLRSFAPCGIAGMQISSEDERRGQCSFPPIRPCLVMVANTSTIARTATSAVISEMS